MCSRAQLRAQEFWLQAHGLYCWREILLSVSFTTTLPRHPSVLLRYIVCYWCCIQSRALSLDPPWKIWMEVQCSEKKNRRQRVASRSDFLGGVHLGEIQVGASTEEWGPWEVEGRDLYGSSGFFVLLLSLTSWMIWIPCAFLWTSYSWPRHVWCVPLEGKSYTSAMGVLIVGVCSVNYFCPYWLSTPRVSLYSCYL